MAGAATYSGKYNAVEKLTEIYNSTWEGGEEGASDSCGIR